MDIINEYCNKYYDNEVWNKLKDDINELKKHKSFAKKYDQIFKVLHKKLDSKISNTEINELTNELAIMNISPGLKGVVRGIKFNKLVEDKLTDICKNSENIELKIEEESDESNERPDWQIICKNGKKIYGYNKIDLWSGGQQINRGNKYIIDNKSSDNIKYVCVIAKKFESKTYNKSAKIMEKGINDRTLYYLKNLDDIVKLIA